MATRGGQEHERKLREMCDGLRSKGWAVVELNGKSPDAVASKDGRMIAVEVLTRYGKEGNYKFRGRPDVKKETSLWRAGLR